MTSGRPLSIRGFALLAYAAAILHGLFILFVLVGGVLSLAWPVVIWAHAPVALWAIFISCIAGTCPLTPLEKCLRSKGHISKYEGGFIDHYIVPVIYPPGLTSAMTTGIIAFLIVQNVTTYTLYFLKS